MAGSPPTSPPSRPHSTLAKPPRSSSRMSSGSRPGESRASDEDTKTSVRVAVRIRPPLKNTDPGYELIPQRFQKSMVQVTSPTSLSVDSPQGRKLFVFDKVFGQEMQQDGVWEYMSDSVNAFLQGYNISIMAYGQSGAGKSYTMGTSGAAEQDDADLMGIVPRAATYLFEKLNSGISGPSTAGKANRSRNGSIIRNPKRYSTSAVQSVSSAKFGGSEQGWEMRATYVEIYNEQLRDLLVEENVPAHERSQVTIREDTKGRILLTGLRQVSINSIEDLLNALNFGSSIRQTDATTINAKSSRSHAVFSLNLVQRKNKSIPEGSSRDKRMSAPVDAAGSDNFVVLDSKFHFVDLAGSERIKNTGASGERAKEGISINAGLASLGKVISQLSRQSSQHVSYRDSKLTRMLQDSLGGNAITYMVACVNPAEFYISETLNTIQYAQRARAIQSKPKIQQISDEGNKQAVIDRLRAEISFLRDQLRNAERSERAQGSAPGERSDMANEREIELQNQLLDAQENYNSLNQRYAMIISEMSKASGKGEGEEGRELNLPEGAAESAAERLKRSTSFSEAVEQVIMEYEKTIQSLEASLGNTRATLSSTESRLLERETKCAFSDTLNQKLQTRVQKFMDREASTEQYVHDLEAKLDGQIDGDERNNAAIVDLRKEIARYRENESASEEYISALEERLAEAVQDSELMQSEISRLENVIHRQRSVGKLDNLLHELDHKQGKDNTAERERGISSAALRIAIDTPIPEEEDERDWEEPAAPVGEGAAQTPRTDKMADAQSPEQIKFVEEKLETVNQELFDLRVEHENTVNDYQMLSQKYDEVLQRLEALQDSGARGRKSSAPVAFLANDKLNEGSKEQDPPLSSRSLSSELSSAGESHAASESFEDARETDGTDQSGEDEETSESDAQDTPKAGKKGGKKAAEAVVGAAQTIKLANKVNDLKAKHMQKAREVQNLRKQYDQLHNKHQETLDQVEDLKTEVHKARMSAPNSPSSQFIRRKSSQNLSSSDRAHRSLASLGVIAAEHFQENVEAKDSFELHTNALLHELNQRNERVQNLEGEIATIKKEMDTKTTIISGLTRERSSLKAQTPVDMGMFTSMRDQILRNETELKTLQETSRNKETQMTREIETLRQSLAAQNGGAAPAAAIDRPQTPDDEASVSKQLEAHRDSNESELRAHVVQLQREVGEWQSKHKATIAHTKTQEKRLMDTISELETTLSNVEQMRQSKIAELEAQGNTLAAASAAFDLERERQMTFVGSLNREIAQNKSAIKAHTDRIAELEDAHEKALKQASGGKDAQRKLDESKAHIDSLRKQVDEHKAQVEFHKSGMRSLHDAHANELEGARIEAAKKARQDAESRIGTLKSQYEDEMAILRIQTADLQAQLEKHEAELQHYQAAAEERGADADSKLEARVKRAEDALREARQQMEDMNATKAELYKELEEVREKEQRSKRLVDELQLEIENSFERNQQGRIRNSQSQDGSSAAKVQEENQALKARIEQLENNRMSMNSEQQGNERSNSMTSNLRKSGSVSNLPSPPPAIPLPPLPNVAAAASGSPPGTAKETPQQSARVEEQEARIKTIEKHLFAEKQLTATLEEALVDLETQGKKTKTEVDQWKKKAWELEDELNALRKERNSHRRSLQAVEEERNARREAEAARAHLEERMAALNKKKKKSSLNCF